MEVRKPPLIPTFSHGGEKECAPPARTFRSLQRVAARLSHSGLVATTPRQDGPSACYFKGTQPVQLLELTQRVVICHTSDMIGDRSKQSDAEFPISEP